MEHGRTRVRNSPRCSSASAERSSCLWVRVPGSQLGQQLTEWTGQDERMAALSGSSCLKNHARLPPCTILARCQHSHGPARVRSAAHSLDGCLSLRRRGPSERGCPTAPQNGAAVTGREN